MPKHGSIQHDIIDIEANEPELDSADTQTRMRTPQTFREKHALKILGVIMGGCFITVIAAQVGC